MTTVNSELSRSIVWHSDRINVYNPTARLKDVRNAVSSNPNRADRTLGPLGRAKARRQKSNFTPYAASHSSDMTEHQRQNPKKATRIPRTVTTRKSYGWLHPQKTVNGMNPCLGFLTSEIATRVGKDAYRIRERIRAGSIPGVQLHDVFNLVVAYAMTFSDIAEHFPLTLDQKIQLMAYPLLPIAGEYKHRVTYSNDLLSPALLKTEFSNLDELKAENPQTFLSNFPESEWLN